MIFVMDENIRLRLLRGNDITIDSDITIKSYKINQIIDTIKINKYEEYLKYIAYTPYDMRTLLYESGIIYEEITGWDIFINSLLNTKNNNNMVEGVKVLLSIDLKSYIPSKNKDGSYVLISPSGNILDQLKFNYIVDIVRAMNGMDSANSQPKFGNRASLVYEVEREIRRRKRNRKLNGDVSLSGIISSIAWNGGNIDLYNIWNLTLYQLYDGLNRAIRIKNYNNLMVGIYTRNIKYDSVNFNKVNWFAN